VIRANACEYWHIAAEVIPSILRPLSGELRSKADPDAEGESVVDDPKRAIASAEFQTAANP
jgi:hypothetical protein